jgi:uncharacterized membrane protein YphA (DoxX/SURF4 family)
VDENQERYDDPTIGEQVQNRTEAGEETPAHLMSGSTAESGADAATTLGEPTPAGDVPGSVVPVSDVPETPVDVPASAESASEEPVAPAAEPAGVGQGAAEAAVPEAIVTEPPAVVSEGESPSEASMSPSGPAADDAVPSAAPESSSADASPIVTEQAASPSVSERASEADAYVAVPATPEAPDEVADSGSVQRLTPPADAIDADAEYSPFRDAATTTAVASGAAATADTAPTAEFSQAQMLAAERAERKAARDKALGNVTRTPEPEPTPTPTVRTTDKFFPSLGLFLLRIVLAGIFGIRSVQHFTNLQATHDIIAATAIPEPAIMAIVLCAGEMLIALGLLFGLLTRVAGFGVSAIAVLALAFVYWGAANPFVEGRFGFSGEYELLLAAVGLLILFTGGGGWGFDRRFRRNRQRRKDTGD